MQATYSAHEQELLVVQERLLTPGWWHVVINPEIIAQLVKLYWCYERVGWLSLSEPPIGTIDIAHEIAAYAVRDVDEYVIDALDVQVLIIHENGCLQATTWYLPLQIALREYALTRNMPVIILREHAVH